MNDIWDANEEELNEIPNTDDFSDDEEDYVEPEVEDDDDDTPVISEVELPTADPRPLSERLANMNSGAPVYEGGENLDDAISNLVKYQKEKKEYQKFNDVDDTPEAEVVDNDEPVPVREEVRKEFIEQKDTDYKALFDASADKLAASEEKRTTCEAQLKELQEKLELSQSTINDLYKKVVERDEKIKKLESMPADSKEIDKLNEQIEQLNATIKKQAESLTSKSAKIEELEKKQADTETLNKQVSELKAENKNLKDKVTMFGDEKAAFKQKTEAMAQEISRLKTAGSNDQRDVAAGLIKELRSIIREAKAPVSTGKVYTAKDMEEEGVKLIHAIKTAYKDELYNVRPRTAREAEEIFDEVIATALGQ